MEGTDTAFATPAGTGDLIVGVTAPLVAVHLVSAITLGVLHSDSAVGLLAVSLVAASGPAWQAAPAMTTAGAAAGSGQAEISRV